MKHLQQKSRAVWGVLARCARRAIRAAAEWQRPAWCGVEWSSLFNLDRHSRRKKSRWQKLKKKKETSKYPKGSLGVFQVESNRTPQRLFGFFFAGCFRSRYWLQTRNKTMGDAIACICRLSQKAPSALFIVQIILCITTEKKTLRGLKALYFILFMHSIYA